MGGGGGGGEGRGGVKRMFADALRVSPSLDWIRIDEVLTLETSALESLYSDQTENTLLILLIKPNIRLHLSLLTLLTSTKL